MISGEKGGSRSIRWGMIGGGKGSNIGYIHRSSALRDNNMNLIAGAFDIVPEKSVAFGRELGVEESRCYGTYQEMLEAEAKREDGIEAVSIATPNSTHYSISKACLEAGLNVVCEKPLCFTYEEAKELEQLATEKDVVFGVTYGYSGHQMVKEARKLIEDGHLGEIRVINTEFAYGFFAGPVEEEFPAAKWRLDPTKAGPSFILGDVGTHSLHMAEIMVPNLKIKELLCVNNYFGKGRKLEDDAHVFMKCENDIFINLWASGINAGSHHGMKIRIIGSKASIEWFAEHPNQLRYEVEGEPVRILERGAGYLHDVSRADDRIGAGHPEGLFESFSNMYRGFAIAIDSKARGEEETPWYPNVHEGAEGVKFVEKCIESSNNGSTWVEY